MRSRLSSPENLSRRELLRFILSAAALTFAGVGMAAASLLRRPIPRSGELLPVIGLGTWQTFDVGNSASARAPLRDVLREFVKLGGSVVDSSPMYGRSESVVGDLAVELGVSRKLFLATKVWTTGRDAGIRQMEESFRRLRTERMDLMQVHNLVDWRTHLATLRDWKRAGRIRYLGITHYQASAFDDLASIMRSEAIDFIQLPMSVELPDAEEALLPLAAERGVAVIVNRPFEGGALMHRVRRKPLPDWAAEFDCRGWSELFLRWIVSHEEVTCVIPATSSVEHLAENLRAGEGRMLDASERRRLRELLLSAD
jgi:diketogulonate reductase-like aldo/keto reductase